MTPEEALREDRAYYQSFLWSQVQVMAQRNQFLLLFQSMLFAALGVLIGKEAFFPSWILIALGLIVSIAWLYVNAISRTNEVHLENELCKLDERFLNVTTARKKFWLLASGSSSRTIAYFFPSLLIVTWVVLLGFYIASR